MERVIPIDHVDQRELFGSYDEHLKILQRGFGVTILVSSKGLIVKGDEKSVIKANQAIDAMIASVLKGEILDANAVEYCVYLAKEGKKNQQILTQNNIVTTYSGEVIKPKSSGQAKYVRKIQSHTLTFGIGPAGTGKTFLAVAVAAKMYKNNEVKRIIITRPAIEAGEKLGFLPGDLQDKVDPYLRPLYDALSTIFGVEAYNRMREKEIIEVAPLAYMRGRTLDDSFIILDEAQNTTINQMKMFLTRFGNNSTVVVNGDITQIDLPRGKMSGLKHAIEILDDIKAVAIATFRPEDVVRHPLVKEIIARYERGGYLGD